MGNDELRRRLLEMTLDDLGNLISYENDVSAGLVKLDLAAKTR